MLGGKVFEVHHYTYCTHICEWLNEMQPLSMRRFLRMTRTTTTVTATAAATPPTAPTIIQDIERGGVSDELGGVLDDAEVELTFKLKQFHS